MRTWAIVLLAAVAISALVLVWGYRYSLNHASLQLRVDDYALKTERQAYGVPHDVTSRFVIVQRRSLPLRVPSSHWVTSSPFIRAPTLATASTVTSAHRPATGRRAIIPRATSSTQPGPRPGHREFTAPMSVSAPASCVRSPSPFACRTTNGGSGGSRSRTLAGFPGNTSTSLSLLTAARARPCSPRNHE
jgi:hypothetical protein